MFVGMDSSSFMTRPVSKKIRFCNIALALSWTGEPPWFFCTETQKAVLFTQQLTAMKSSRCPWLNMNVGKTIKNHPAVITIFIDAMVFHHGWCQWHCST